MKIKEAKTNLIKGPECTKKPLGSVIKLNTKLILKNLNENKNKTDCDIKAIILSVALWY